MVDIVNDRVNEAQSVLKQRAERLERLVKSTKNRKMSAAFNEGINILQEMISGQSELIDKLVFEAPKTAIEQMRNLQLTTGGMNETPTEFLSNLTGAIDGMFAQLEEMAR